MLHWSYTIQLNAELSTQSPSPFTIPPHTHSGKKTNRSQRSLSNPSSGSALKRKGFFMVFHSSGIRSSRSSQAWRSQVRKMAQLVFPEASLLLWLCWKEAQAEQCAWHRCDTGPTHSSCCLCLWECQGWTQLNTPGWGESLRDFQATAATPFVQWRKALAGRKMQKKLAKDWKFFLAVLF